MFGVIVIKESNIVHGIVPDLVRITEDSVFGTSSSMEGINMDVCAIYAFDTEVTVGETLPEGLVDHSSKFKIETDSEKIARLEKDLGNAMLEIMKMKMGADKL